MIRWMSKLGATLESMSVRKAMKVDRLEGDERGAPDDDRLVADGKCRPGNELGAIDVGVDDDRAACRPIGHPRRAARNAVPSSSERSSMRICSGGGSGRARLSSSSTDNSRCPSGLVGAGSVEDIAIQRTANAEQRPSPTSHRQHELTLGPSPQLADRATTGGPSGSRP